MILYNTNKWEEIQKNSYIFQSDEGFAKYLFESGMFFTEENIVDLIKNKISNSYDGVFIDIGANIGAYTMCLAKNFIHTYAFEPVVNTYNILCGNIAINDLSNITTLINAGLSDYEHEMIMHEYDTLGSLTHLTEDETDTLDQYYKNFNFYNISSKITVKTLDQYNIENVKLIKIDVEGNELKVLKGAENTIKKSNYPVLILESWHIDNNDTDEIKEYKSNLRNELFTYVKNLGYNISNTQNPEVFICEYNAVKEQQETKKKVKQIFY